MSVINKPRLPHVHVPLVGEDSNALAIIGRARLAMRRAGIDEATREEYCEEATSDDYDHLLATTMSWFSVTPVPGVVLASPRTPLGAQARFMTAVDAINQAGVRFVFNVDTDCRCCVVESDLGIESKDVPYAWTHGGPVDEVHWDESGDPYTLELEPECECDNGEEWDEEIEESSYYEYTCDLCSGHWRPDSYPASSLYVNHGPDLSVPTLVTQVFRDHGFQVEWDGSLTSCVEVHFAEAI